jgi:hypothetical protein
MQILLSIKADATHQKKINPWIPPTAVIQNLKSKMSDADPKLFPFSSAVSG